MAGGDASVNGVVCRVRRARYGSWVHLIAFFSVRLNCLYNIFHETIGLRV